MQPYASNNSENHSERAERNIWQTLGTLYRWRRLIIGATAVVAAASVVISLLLPNWYRASTRLLPPSSTGGSGITNFISDSDLAPLASSLLGGPGGDYMRFMSLLTSNTVMGSVVDEFDLEEVYETTDSEAPRQYAIQALKDNVEFVIDDEYEHLSVEVYDKDPQRAADIANYFAEQLNKRYTELSTQNAASYRKFVEERYHEAEAKLDSARMRKQQFEEKHGVVQLPDQAREFLTSLAELRASTVQNQIQLEALREQYGASNSRVASLQHAVQAAREQQEQMLSGSDVLLPVAYQNLPAVSRQYAQIMQEVTIQEQIVKYVRPLYEQALFDEQKNVTAVQVIDPATPPVQDSWPPRAIICIMATLSGLLLSVLAVLTYAWFHRNRTYLATQIRSEAAASEKRPEPEPSHTTPS